MSILWLTVALAATREQGMSLGGEKVTLTVLEAPASTVPCKVSYETHILAS